MNRLHTLLPMLGLTAAASLALVGCGEDNNTTCGTGTVLQDGMCVPSSTTTCGAGTTLTAGQCVPDGSVICEQGTRFDMASGQCVLDPSACADGTVLVGDECVPEDDTLMADLEEAAEPNDATGAGQLDVPALNAMTTIHGCVSPRGGAADEDVWVLNAAAPTLLEITADGVGGLAAGFIVQDNGIATLPNYVRFGINLTGDTSKRQVYLPVAGTYVLVMDDSRALLTGEASGNAATCYFTTIKSVALPAAVTATLPQTAGTDAGNVSVYTYTPGMIGDIFDVGQNTASQSLRTAFILRKNGAFYASAAYDATNDVPPFYTVGGLEATDTVDVIVDNVYNFGLTPQPYTLDMFDIAAAPLPRDGSVLTLTKHNGEHPTASYVDSNFSYFDVNAGEVVRFNVTSSVAANMYIVRHDIFTPAGALDAVAALTGGTAPATRTAFTDQFVRFRQAGRYYLITRDPTGVAAATYTLTSTLNAAVPPALTYGTAATAQALPAGGSGFHTLDLTNPEWIEFGVTGTDWGVAGNTARVTLYDLAGEGWLASNAGSTGANYLAVQSGTQPSAGSAPIGRVTLGDARDFLVRVQDSGTPGAAPTYDVVARDRAHVSLGTIVAGTPLVRTNTDATAPSAVTRYLVVGTAGQRLSAQVTPTDATVDISLQRRNADETIPAVGGTFNAGTVGAAETLSAVFGPAPSWVAYTVTNLSVASPTNLSLNATATPPIPFVDICATGTVLPAPFDGTGDDDYSAVQTLPGGFTFNFFGVAQTQFIVGANGILAFGATEPTCSFGCYSNGTIPGALPTTQPNGFIAAYWDDQENIRVCRKDEATKVTLQWTGDLYASTNETVQYQVVLNTNGTIDFIYGPNHLANGSSATVGAESATGTAGVQVTYNTAGGTPPNSSYSITTPAP